METPETHMMSIICSISYPFYDNIFIKHRFTIQIFDAVNCNNFVVLENINFSH